MRVVAIADLHGFLPPVPRCDLLLVAGDLCPVENHDLPFQERWLRTSFAPWLEATPARHRVGLAGNHDRIAEARPDLLKALPWTYLCDDGVELDGRLVWGSPWQRPFLDGAFMLPEQQLRSRWALIPSRTAVLVTHAPPHGVGDNVGAEQIGSPSLFDRTLAVSPELHVFGHAHDGRGVYRRPHGLLANVAITDSAYQPAHAPMVFELPVRARGQRDRPPETSTNPRTRWSQGGSNP